MAGIRKRLLTSDLAGWRMAGPGGFRRLSNGILESYGGPGIFWYAHFMASSIAPNDQAEPQPWNAAGRNSVM